MAFISFAQNCEDVMLWRALGHVPQGFYIDVGAWSPDEDSVTRAFYERGWRGINIEPNPEFAAQLRDRRPEDINLALAVSDRPGEITLNILGDSGLATADDALARQHGEAGWPVTRHVVQAMTLAQICRDHVAPGQEIHFLKVDVEGLEEAVLRGHDWQAFRPWIVVVEATLPNTQTEAHAGWEPVLTGAGYGMAYADGLNRFYLAQERADLLPSLRYPPNVFDAFVTARQDGLKRAFDWAQAVLTAQDARVSEMERSLAALDAGNAEARAWLEARLAALGARLEEDMPALGARLEEDMAALGARLEALEIRGAGAEALIRSLESSHAHLDWRLNVMDRDHTLALDHVTWRLNVMQRDQTYLARRRFWERLLFRPDGRPVRLLRRILFHKNGRPRGEFRGLVLRKDRSPRRAFAHWMTGEAYRRLPGAIGVPGQGGTGQGGAGQAGTGEGRAGQGGARRDGARGDGTGRDGAGHDPARGMGGAAGPPPSPRMQYFMDRLQAVRRPGRKDM